MIRSVIFCVGWSIDNEDIRKHGEADGSGYRTLPGWLPSNRRWEGVLLARSDVTRRHGLPGGRLGSVHHGVHQGVSKVLPLQQSDVPPIHRHLLPASHSSQRTVDWPHHRVPRQGSVLLHSAPPPIPSPHLSTPSPHPRPPTPLLIFPLLNERSLLKRVMPNG